jgi:hypothetical protein
MPTLGDPRRQKFEGRKVRLPVSRGRRPAEHFERDLYCFYTRLLDIVSQEIFHDGEWALCQPTGWQDNGSYRNLLAWAWTLHEDRCLIAVNLSDVSSQGLVRIPWRDVSDKTWHLVGLISNDFHTRGGNEILSKGLYVALGPWGYHFLRFVQASDSSHEFSGDAPAKSDRGEEAAN